MIRVNVFGKLIMCLKGKIKVISKWFKRLYSEYFFFIYIFCFVMKKCW